MMSRMPRLSTKISFIFGMKRFAFILLAITGLFAFSSCKEIIGDKTGEDEKGLDIELTRDQVIGKWQVNQAKFAEDAKMSEWDFTTTTFEFMENGLFDSSGFFGNNEGVFTVSGNKVNTTLENKPFMTFLLTAIDEEKNVSVTATVESTGSKIWMICHKVKDVNGGGEPGVVSYETMFRQEQYVQQYLAKTYTDLSNYLKLQLEIEGRICKGDFSDLNSSSSTIKDLWVKAYKVVTDCAIALTYLPVSNPQNIMYYQYQFSALRGVIAYQLATTWGHAWFYNTPPEATDIPVICPGSQLLDSAYYDLLYSSEMTGSIPAGYIDNATALTFMSFVQLTRGQPETIAPIVKDIKEKYHKNEVVFSFYYTNPMNNQQTPIEVFNAKTLQLLNDEATGQRDKLNEGWKSSGLSYGYWQMLTRTKMAPSVIGCQEYQMLFPIPKHVMDADMNMVQNPGY